MTRLLAVLLSCLFLASCALLENQGIVLEDFVDPVADNAERIVINQETVQDPNAESASTPVQVDPDPAPIEEVALSPTQPSQGGLGTATTTAIATTNPPVIGVDQTGSLIEPEQFATESMVKVERTVAAGPDLEDTFESGVTPQKRELVSREEPKNYMDLNEQREDLFPITINLDNVDIRDAMTMLSEIIGKNILVGDEVSGTISVRLINVPWNKALDAILQIRKLAKHVNEEGTIIRIHEQAALIAQEAFERQRRSDLIAALEAEEAIGPLFTEIFRLFYTEPKVVKKELQEVLGIGDPRQGAGAANTYGVQIAIDTRIKALIIKGNRQDLDSISQLISKIDVRTQQVLIEAFIVEATDDFSREFGARFGVSDVGVVGDPSSTTQFTKVTTGGVAGTQPDTPGDVKLGDLTGLATNFAVTGGAGIGLMVQSASTLLKAELTAMEKQGFSKIVSNPRVFTLDNQEAEINVGQDVPVRTQERSSGGGTS